MTGRPPVGSPSAPDTAPLWARLDVQPYGDRWAAMLVGDGVPPKPDALTGLTFFGATPEEAERRAQAFLGLSEPMS